MEDTLVQKYTFKDFQSDQEVRWCPGCDDYVIHRSGGLAAYSKHRAGSRGAPCHRVGDVWWLGVGSIIYSVSDPGCLPRAGSISGASRQRSARTAV